MATYYFRNVGTAWNNTSSWSTTSSSGTSAGAVPTSADNVIFDSGSALSCPVTTTAGVCLTLNTTGYTGTITLNTTVTVSGSITLGASTTLSGTSALICNATATLTSNSNANINCPFTFNNPAATNNTYTLADNWTLNALFSTTANAGALTHTINGNNLYCKGGITINGGSLSSATLTTGTTVIHIIATGTATFGAANAQGLGNSLTFNAPGGTITIPSANIYYKTGTLKYIAGTLSGTSNIVPTGNFTADMNNGGLNYVTPFSIVSSTNVTVTMLSDWYLSIISATPNTLTINGSSIYCTGTVGGTTTGTTTIRLKGSVSGQSVAFTTGNDISIEAGSNIVNIGNINITPRSGGTSVTYSSGTVNNTGIVTITGPNSLTLNTSGVNWNNVTYANTSITTTINSLFSISGTLTFGTGSYTFAGSAGFTANTAIYNSLPATTNTGIILAPGNTYTVTNALTLYSTTIGGNILGIKSSTPGSVAYFKLNQGATLSVGNVQVTDIDSSGGQTIWAWRPGTLSNAINWRALTNASMQFASLFAN